MNVYILWDLIFQGEPKWLKSDIIIPVELCICWSSLKISLQHIHIIGSDFQNPSRRSFDQTKAWMWQCPPSSQNVLCASSARWTAHRFPATPLSLWYLKLRPHCSFPAPSLSSRLTLWRLLTPSVSLLTFSFDQTSFKAFYPFEGKCRVSIHLV